MMLLLEYSPLVAFGVGYWLGGIYVATISLMVAATLMLASIWLWKRRVTTMNVVSTLLLLALGGLTLVMHNVRFIQWKPTLIFWLLSLAFLGSIFIGTQPLAQRMLQPVIGEVQVDRRSWLKLNATSIAFCILLGCANLLVAYRASEATWVKVKLFGLTGVMFLFLLAQIWWLLNLNRGENQK
ncbi:MAG: septation protein IspZ [Pseudomonadota bacterium]